MTRHFHATILIIIGIIVLFFLSLAVGQAPHFQPKFTTTPSISTTPTPTPQTTFLYDDNNGSYQSISTYTLETALKEGVYGEPTSSTTTYTNFNLYNGQIYLKGANSSAIINLDNHFFYPVNVSQIPYTISPSYTKELFITSITDPKTKINSQQFILQTSTATTASALTYPSVIGEAPQPLCWSHDENTIVFSTPQKALFYYSLTNQKAKQASLSAQLNRYTNVYCNSNTDTLYFITQNSVYKKGFGQLTSQKLSISPSLFTVAPLFSSTLPDTILVGSANALLQVDLDKNITKQLYVATDSAAITPYLWQGNSIVYTQENIKPESGQYYLIGKIFDTASQVDTVFAKHQANTITSLGNITPFAWLHN
jgi:hypothetical protein